MNIFRQAQFSDHENIKKTFQAVRDGLQNKLMFNWPDALIESELNRSLFYISETSEHQIKAFICYRTATDLIEILSLGTLPEWQGQGVMTGLLIDFVQLFGKDGVHIHLEVHIHNQKAIAVYNHCGFKLLRIRKAYYQDGGDCAVMSFPA